MKKEIERKFLVKTLPNLENLEKVEYERYFIFKNSNVEIRIQKKWNKFEFERKEKLSELSSSKQKFEISKEEFEYLKSISNSSIIRDSYLISTNPEISIKVYHWKFEWLVRVEVEFLDEDSAKEFIPLDWFWKEITDLPLWKDSKLLSLTDEQFNSLIWN